MGLASANMYPTCVSLRNIFLLSVCLCIAYLFDAGTMFRDELRRYQDDLRRNQDDLRYNLSDLQKSIRTFMEKIERRLDDHHASQTELFRHNRQLQRKQDQLALKQDQLLRLLSGEKSMGSPPPMPVIFPSPSPKPSPGFSRRSSISPVLGRPFPTSPSYVPLPSPSVTVCSELSSNSLKQDQTTSSVAGASDLQSLCESFMSELDFDFTPFLEGITSTISSATTDSVVFTAPVQSLSTSLDVFPSEGCLPGNGPHVSETNTLYYHQPQALPLHNMLSGGGCLSGLDNVATSVGSTSTSKLRPETMLGNTSFTTQSATTSYQLTFKSPEQVVQENRGLCTIQGAGQLAIALARQSFFGVHTLVRSSITGKSGPALDDHKLGKMQEFLRKSVFPSVQDSEFALLWKNCKKSLSNHIKHERQKLKKLAEQ